MLEDVNETQIELSKIRCPRCAGELVLRIGADEEAGAVRLVLDTACISCGVAPWADSDQRLLVFRPGAPIGAALSGAAADYAAEMAAAQARVDALLRRCDELEREVEARASTSPASPPTRSAAKASWRRSCAKRSPASKALSPTPAPKSAAPKKRPAAR